MEVQGDFGGIGAVAVGLRAFVLLLKPGPALGVLPLGQLPGKR